MSCCHHKVFTHQEPPTSFPTYWSSDQNKCHVWAGMGPGLSASDDLPWKEALGLSLHWQVCEHQLCGSRKTGSWGAGEMLQGQGELVVAENGVCRAQNWGRLQDSSGSAAGSPSSLSTLPPAWKAGPGVASLTGGFLCCGEGKPRTLWRGLSLKFCGTFFLREISRCL